MLFSGKRYVSAYAVTANNSKYSSDLIRHKLFSCLYGMTSDMAGALWLLQSVRYTADKGFIQTRLQVHHGNGRRLETVHQLLKFLLSSDKTFLLIFYWPKKVPQPYLTLKRHIILPCAQRKNWQCLMNNTSVTTEEDVLVCYPSVHKAIRDTMGNHDSLRKTSACPRSLRIALS